MTSSSSTATGPDHRCRTIVYISRPAAGLTIDDVHRLVFEARGFNAMNGLHGLLTYDPRGFFQVLEGSDDAVTEMWAKVQVDRRHHGITVYHDALSEERGFLNFSDHVCEGEGRADAGLLPVTARARLSDDVIAAIEAAYAAL